MHQARKCTRPAQSARAAALQCFETGRKRLPMTVFESLAESGPLLRDAIRSGNLRVMASMLGPAFRGLVRQRGRNEESTPVRRSEEHTSELQSLAYLVC